MYIGKLCGLCLGSRGLLPDDFVNKHIGSEDFIEKNAQMMTLMIVAMQIERSLIGKKFTQK